MRNAAAWVVLPGRTTIIATGDDRARLLHAMTTNAIQTLAPGEGCYAFFLSAQGRILADANVICRPDYFVIDSEPEVREKLLEHLDQFIIADDVTIEDATETLATIAVEGPASADVLSKSGAPVPEKELASEEWNGTVVVRASITGGPGYLLILPRERAKDVTTALAEHGAVAADAAALDLVRMEYGRPRYGEDISERYLAQEANQPRALSFSKGCYLGQEIVERVRSRGQIHRVLLPMQIDTAEPPEARAILTDASGNKAGEITSAVFSPTLGKVAALAYVRVDYARAGTELRLGDTVAHVMASHEKHQCC